MEKGAKDIMSGWNGSDRKGAAPVQPKVTAKKPSPVRGLIAGGAVVVLAAVAYFAFFSGSEKPQTEKSGKERGRIKEVAPAAAPTNAVPAKPEKVVEIRQVGDGKIMKYVNGKPAWMYPRQDYHGPVHTSGQHRVLSTLSKTFKNCADIQIASLLTRRPGDMCIGDPQYERNFVSEFLRSFKNPAIPEPGDTEEQKELKRAVAEVKGDLKARYDAGEDIAKIMRDADNELRQLGAYKKELEEQVRELSKKDDVSAQDIEDYVAAANKMLEERGIRPMAINGFLKHQIRIRKATEKENK